jgi:hypothetical protein
LQATTPGQHAIVLVINPRIGLAWEQHAGWAAGHETAAGFCRHESGGNGVPSAWIRQWVAGVGATDRTYGDLLGVEVIRAGDAAEAVAEPIA